MKFLSSGLKKNFRKNKPPEESIFPFQSTTKVASINESTTTSPITSPHLSSSSTMSATTNSSSPPSTTSGLETFIGKNMFNNLDLMTFDELPSTLNKNLKPLLFIARSLNKKKYYIYRIDDNTARDKWQVHYANGIAQTIQEIRLVGTTLSFTVNDTFQNFTIPIIDPKNGCANFQLFDDNLAIKDPNIALSINNTKQLNYLCELLTIAIFENISMFKAITATVISTMGLYIPDIKIILSPQFNFKDWCEIYIEGQGWVKSWCHINKRNTLKGKFEPKGKYQIKFYKDNKSADPTSPSNLICYISDIDYVQDVFFYNQNPDDYNDDTFMTNLNTIKILGDVKFNNSPTKLRERKSSNIFPVKRDISTSAISEKKSLDIDIQHTGLLIRPLAHNGLPHVDSMIKFIIPIFDVTRKYGRPEGFSNSKDDINSLMFGLPRLPNYNFFNKDEIKKILHDDRFANINKKEINDFLSFAMKTSMDTLVDLQTTENV